MNLVCLSVCVSTHCSPTDFQELVQGYSFLLDFQDEFQIAQQFQKLLRGGIDRWTRKHHTRLTLLFRRTNKQTKKNPTQAQTNKTIKRKVSPHVLLLTNNTALRTSRILSPAIHDGV